MNNCINLMLVYSLYRIYIQLYIHNIIYVLVQSQGTMCQILL